MARPGTPADPRPLYLAIARVSTEEQATRGYSLAAQTGDLEREADRRNVRVEIIPVPGHTGAKVSPQLRDALDRLQRREAQGLMVTKLDRLTRSVSVANDIMAAAQTQGWNLVVADLGIDFNTPSGRAMANMLATFAQFERELISERVKAGMAAAKKAGTTKTGRPIGRPPLVPQHIADHIRQEHEKGNSFRLIAEDLTAVGVLSPEGKHTWQASTVRRIYDRQTKRAAA